MEKTEKDIRVPQGTKAIQRFSMCNSKKTKRKTESLET